MTVTTYTITIPNWGKWQKPMKGDRRWICVSRGLFDDPKIQFILKKDNRCLMILMWIWCQVDEVGVLKISKDVLKTNMISLLYASNRFNLEKRLEWLIESQLISIDVTNESYSISNDILKPLEKVSNGFLMDSYCDPNGVLNPLETSETRTALRATTEHNITVTIPNGIDASLRPGQAKLFEKPINEAYTDPIWGVGLDLLTSSGITEPTARSFLGRAVKAYGEGALKEAISSAVLAGPAEPKSYLMACLKGNTKPSAATKGIRGSEVHNQPRKGGIIEL